MGKCTNCIRGTLIAFNVIFMLCGIALISAAAYVFATSVNIETVTHDRGIYTTGTALVMVAGILTFIASAFGCFGAIKRSQCALITYFIFLVVIFILELAGGIYAGTNSQTVTNAIASSVLSDIRSKYNVANNVPFTTAINHLQQNLKCCGVNAYTDYTGSSWATSVTNATNINPVPKSCCITPSTDCGTRRTNNAGIYTAGCRTAVENAVTENLKIILGVGIAIAIIQLFGLVASMMMVCDIKKEGEVV